MADMKKPSKPKMAQRKPQTRRASANMTPKDAARLAARKKAAAAMRMDVAESARRVAAKPSTKKPSGPSANRSVRAAAYRAANAEGNLWGAAKPKSRPLVKGPKARSGSRTAISPMEAVPVKKKKEIPAGQRGTR